MRYLYTFLFYLAIPFILLRLLWRAYSAPAYAKRWAERFGFFPPLITDKEVVWLHAVSVGEFIAALPLIRYLQARGDLQLVITTTTPTGSERVRASLGDTVFHVYAPYDLPDVLGRFIRRVKPSLLLIMETELWPNTLASCLANNIPSILVNARMSEKSAKGYEKFSAITRPMLQCLSVALVQNTTDAQRFQRLGLPQSKIEITGNIKFDLTLADDLIVQAAELKKLWSNNGAHLTWIAASTHPGEDEIILAAYAECIRSPLLASLRLVLVPRHPERFTGVVNLCANRGFQVVRRSEKAVAAETQIIVGDTMGELLLMFGAADIAFVGGSLVPNGGHNFIEPAVWQLPLLSGCYLFNFAEVAGLLENAGALILVTNAKELAQQIERLSLDASARKLQGKAAAKVANDNRGALEKTRNAINSFLN